MSVMNSLSAEFDLALMITRTFRVIRRSLPVFTALTLFLYGLPLLGKTVAHMLHASLPVWPGAVFSATSALYALAAALGYFALQAAVVHATVSELDGRPAGLIASLRTGVNFFLPILGLCLLICIPVAFGFVLLYIPGAYLVSMWLVAIPALVIERQGITQSLSRSTKLTEGFVWPIVGLVTIFLLTSWLFSHVLSTFGNAFDHISVLGYVPHYATELAQDLFRAIAAMVGSVGATVVYAELRRIKEGVEPEELSEAIY
ncbi:hypothetical protein BH11PSE2_BH11PSE2_13680 [soil metagenome]